MLPKSKLLPKLVDRNSHLQQVQEVREDRKSKFSNQMIHWIILKLDHKMV